MDRNYNTSEINNSICEAIGCFAKATNKIALEVGTYGVFSVLVCRNCIGKFQDYSAQEVERRKSGVNSDR